MSLAFEHEHVCAALLGEMISDTRSNYAAANDDDVCGFSHNFQKTLASEVRRKHRDEGLKSKGNHTPSAPGDLTKVHSSQQVLKTCIRPQVIEGGIDLNES